MKKALLKKIPVIEAGTKDKQYMELCRQNYLLKCTFRINGAPFPRQRCKRLAPAVRYPFVVTC